MTRTAPSNVMWLQRARTLALWLLGVLVAASIGLLLAPNPAHADTVTRVNSMQDAGDNNPGNGACATAPFQVGTEPNCTLRAAIQEANVNGVSDTITFDSALSGTITLTLGQLEIVNDTTTNDLIIEGPGARRITVSGNGASRVFMIDEPAHVTIHRLAISNGNAEFGSGIYNDNGTLIMTNSTVSDNTAETSGGGIYSGEGTLIMTNSTVSDNTANNNGGGIYNSDATLALGNSTVSGNTANNNGGGIYNGETLELTNSTLSGNTAGISGGGTYNAGVTLKLSNTIIARNSANTSPDTRGTFTSQGSNLIGNTTGSSGWIASDLLNLNPLLGPLQNNGGPTNTHALLPGSRAVDKGANIACPFTDQRGVTRKDGDGNGTIVCDIGSFESKDLTPPKVKRVVPAENATGVAPATNVSAFFSEAMRAGSINTKTVRLFKAGTTTPLAAVVSYDAAKKKATLNPNANLKRGAKYKAVVAVGARDLAGNRLDQNPSVSGNQPKKWFFKVRN